MTLNFYCVLHIYTYIYIYIELQPIFFCFVPKNTDRYEYEDDHLRYYPVHSPPPPLAASESEIPILPLSDSDVSVANSEIPRSVISTRNESGQPSGITDNTDILQAPGPSTEPSVANPVPVAIPGSNVEAPGLPADILEALGDPKGKEEIYGPKIPEEIAERWGRVLVDGLTKEHKQQLAEKHLVPDNFRLAKAPLLNPEIVPVLNDGARNRDKLMEKSQNQLGLGISELTNLASCVIREDLNKVELLKKISDISQIFLDLHYEDTKRRRKLITASLDKKFLHMISDIKRDTYLFGTNLGDKIKASKTAERSGLQIKRSDPAPSTSKRYQQQGNWRGPPRVQAQRTHKQGGPRTRYGSQHFQPSRRFPTAVDRPTKTATKITKTQKP